MTYSVSMQRIPDTPRKFVGKSSSVNLFDMQESFWAPMLEVSRNISTLTAIDHVAQRHWVLCATAPGPISHAQSTRGYLAFRQLALDKRIAQQPKHVHRGTPQPIDFPGLSRPGRDRNSKRRPRQRSETCSAVCLQTPTGSDWKPICLGRGRIKKIVYRDGYLAYRHSNQSSQYVRSRPE